MPDPAADALRELQDTVGVTNARTASAADAIDDASVLLFVEPASVTELAAVLRVARRRHLAVVPRGSGTKLRWGAPLTCADMVLSTRRLDRVLEHSAGDLVVRTEAGVPLALLQDKLRTFRQMVALDPPAGGTIGGIVATNAAGPRRLRYGAPRDLLIGVTVALADGTSATAGGKVVKNVAGYDLGKLFAGSFGTLGVITETVFRLHPLPESYAFVHASFGTAARAAQGVRAVAQSMLVPNAVELTWSPSDGAALVVLIEGVSPAVLDQVERATQLLSPFATELVVNTPREWRWPIETWPRIGPDDVRVKLITLPGDLAATLEAVAEAARARDVTVRVTGQAASGVLYASLGGGAPVQVAEMLADLRVRLTKRSGSLILLEAPPYVKHAVDAWGLDPSVLRLMRRVKAEFDSDNQLSPGRM